MQNNRVLLDELIQLCQDGYKFYCLAADRTDDEILRNVFLQMARTKRDLVKDLFAHTSLSGEKPAECSTWARTIHAVYVVICARLNDSDRLSRDDRILIVGLAEAENGLLWGFRAALARIDSPTLRSLLMCHVTKLQEAHNEMRRLIARGSSPACPAFNGSGQ